MIDLELSWRQAGVAATGLIVASVALRAARKPRLAAIAVFTQESGLILGCSPCGSWRAHWPA
jgi:hypothetical protein